MTDKQDDLRWRVTALEAVVPVIAVQFLASLPPDLAQRILDGIREFKVSATSDDTAAAQHAQLAVEEHVNRLVDGMEHMLRLVSEAKDGRGGAAGV